MTWWAWVLLGAWAGWSWGYVAGARKAVRREAANRYHVYAPGEEDHPEDCECRWYPPGTVMEGSASKVACRGWMRKESDKCPTHSI